MLVYPTQSIGICINSRLGNLICNHFKGTNFAQSRIHEKEEPHQVAHFKAKPSTWALDTLFKYHVDTLIAAKGA